ncbi:MAG: Ig-like domain-containing protein [Gemmataceae bacterium]
MAGEVVDVSVTTLAYVSANAIFTTATTITETNLTYDGKDVLVDGTTVAIDGPHQFNSVHLVNGGVLTHTADSATQTHKISLSVTQQVIVDATSAINVGARGYVAGYTSGNIQAGGSGGSHGGRGGGGPAVYDDYRDPDDAGGGGSGVGGGVVRVTAGSLALDGGIYANGLSGGAGGGIFVSVGTLTGAGSIQASGGFAAGRFTGGGAGGRVAVYYRTHAGFGLANVAAGGAGSPDGPYGGAGTVFILQNEPHTHVRSHAPAGGDIGFVDHGNGFLAGPILAITLKTNNPLDLTTFTPAAFEITGQMGRVTPTGITLVGDRTYRIDLPFPLTENGTYHFRLLPTVKDVDGFFLDQDADGVPGEPVDDVYTFDLTVDTVGPRVTQHTPAGDISGTISNVDVFFSERLDPAQFTTADITVTRPDGQPVAVSSLTSVGLNRYRIAFPAQTLVGTYHVRIGPDVRDLAGNKLDIDRDGTFGEPADDVYDARFNLVQVDLGLSNLALGAAALVAGEPLAVSWQGRNQTGVPLVGDWVDAVYLSRDDRWDITDPLLATVPHTGGLAAGATYTGSATVNIPGTLPGDYRILVRADVANQERETNEANNLVASPALPLAVRALTPGTAARGTLTPSDRADYFAVLVAPGDNLAVILRGLAASGVNELYVRRDAIPTRQDYDYRAVKDESRVDGQDQQIVASAPAEGGTYYVLVYGEQIGTTTPYTLTARTGSLIVAGLTPDHHGNSATAMMTIRGAGFDDTTTVEFVDSDGVVRLPVETRFVSADTLTLTLNLPNWAADTYDVRLRKSDAVETLTDAFRVTAGGTAHLETNLVVPSAVGFNIPIRQTIWVEYKNTGDVVMPAPQLQLTGTFGARLTTDPTLQPRAGFGEIVGTSDNVQLLGLGKSATPWLLQPGESVRVPVYYLGLSQAASYPQVTFALGTLTADDPRPIDWSTQEYRLRPTGLDDSRWVQFKAALERYTGTTWGGYVSALSSALSTDASPTHATSVGDAWQALTTLTMRLSGLTIFGTINRLGPDEFPTAPAGPQCPDSAEVNALYISLINKFNQLDFRYHTINNYAEQLQEQINDLLFDGLERIASYAASVFSVAALVDAVIVGAVTKGVIVPAQARVATVDVFNTVGNAYRVYRDARSADINNLLHDFYELGNGIRQIAGRSYFNPLINSYHVFEEWYHDAQALVDYMTNFSASASGLNGRIQDNNKRIADYDLILQGYNLSLADYNSRNVPCDQKPDVHPAIIVFPMSGLLTSEDGTNATFSVVLSTVPTDEVRVILTVGDPTEESISTTTLVFAPGVLNLPQTLTITGVDDTFRDGDIVSAIFLSIFSADPNYNGLPGATIRVTNQDNDAQPLWPSQPLLPPFNPGGSGTSRTIGSFDPNDKLGPAGVGDEAIVRADSSLVYTVRFENKSDATAPARQIVVTDVLDPNLDLDTFELTEITFANQTVTVPAGLTSYETRSSMTAGGAGILADVRATLDRATRTVTLTLQAVDPATGWFPEDPLVGLLYPNDAAGRGVGSVSYTVRPKAGLQTGTVVANRASITFDYNDPIDTPLVRNTLDAAAPTSRVTTPSGTTTGTEIALTWAGADDAGGSGIAGYDVYASTDGGIWTQIVFGTAETSATFVATPGHTYAFYSVARDNVGHVEAVPLAPDTVLIVTSANRVPTDITPAAASVAENSAPGTVVATLTAIDPDAGDTHTFTLVTDAGGRFRVIGNQLLVAGPIDFEATPVLTVRVRSTDAGGLSVERDLTITLVDVPEAVGFGVQNGQAQRSYIRYLSLTLDSAQTARALLQAGRVRLVRYDLSGNNPVSVPVGTLSVAGNVLTIDFGVYGIGGNRNSNVGDGYYRLEVDLDGDGAFETGRSFYRLLGDTNGDRKVDDADTTSIDAAIRGGVYVGDFDLNGDGVVDATDRLLALRHRGRFLAPWLPLDG